MAIKLDMAKAFNRVERPFLVAVMLRLGFREQWMDLGMKCVKSASFAFLVSGTPSNP